MNKIWLFFILMLISLLGNACADYALIWFAISKGATVAKHEFSLSFIFIGQGIGVSILAPIFSVYFDRYQRKYASFTIDIIYAAILFFCILLNNFGKLDSFFIFFVALTTSALSTTHKSGVAFSALQEASHKDNITKNVSLFMMITGAATMIGSAISGSVYRYLGLNGCLWVGIITFIPIMFSYFWIFKNHYIERAKDISSFFKELFDAFEILKADKVILYVGFSIGALNIASGIMPGIVGLSFHKYYPARSDYYTWTIAFGLLMAIIAMRPLGKLARNFKANVFIFVSVVPAIVALTLCYFIPHPLMLTLMFALWQTGSTIRWVTSGSLRISRIPKNMMGRVNTIYASLINIGQIFGGLLIVPVAQQNFNLGLLFLILILGASSVISFYFLPSIRIKDIL